MQHTWTDEANKSANELPSSPLGVVGEEYTKRW